MQLQQVDVVGAQARERGVDRAQQALPRGAQLVSRRLAHNERVLCASPDYLRRRGEPQTPAELTHHDCLLLGGRDGRHERWPLTGTDGEPLAVRVGGRFESNYGEALREAAVGGLGIALHSVWQVPRPGRRAAAGRPAAAPGRGHGYPRGHAGPDPGAGAGAGLRRPARRLLRGAALGGPLAGHSRRCWRRLARKSLKPL
ncbi:LysR substrate-binding domain-containing protein [Luteimonas composti]|uniref:LysR substrate-binding domain-containing protein n=1 Tax=Luteimonas composti TaxID=398257 RepID=UPI00315921E8